VTAEYLDAVARGTTLMPGPDSPASLIFANGAVSGAIVGAAYGAITGVALAFLLHPARPAVHQRLG
jgi:hypothetical protein